jgi:hypothetical protein
MGVLRKKKKQLKHTVIPKYFFLEILINVKINVKAGRVNLGTRKVHDGLHGARGHYVGQACLKQMNYTRLLIILWWNFYNPLPIDAGFISIV